MTKSTVTLSGRVPEPVKERVEEMAEEREMSQSMMMRELLREAIEHKETDTEPGQSTRSAVSGSVEQRADLAQLLAGLGILTVALSLVIQSAIIPVLSAPYPVAAFMLETVQNLLLAVAAVLVAFAVKNAVEMYLEGDPE